MEIGASANNDFFLDTVNVDFRPDPSTSEAQLRYAGRVRPVDVIAPADALPFADDEVDFVLASHVIEHVPDPFKALLEWARVASLYVLVVVPQRDNPYDRNKPLSTFEELHERQRTGFASDQDRHWNVWTSATFVEHCARLGLEALAVQDPDDKRGNGFAVLLAT